MRLVSGVILGLLALGLSIKAPAADATPVRIVALGASNTAGKGVASSSAWPADLQRLLRARGYDARIANAGISGDDTTRMLNRLDRAVPKGTRIVILEKAAANDRLRSVDTQANVERITDLLHARGIEIVVIDSIFEWSNRQFQADHLHITEAGHAAVAARLLPEVVAAIAGLRPN